MKHLRFGLGAALMVLVAACAGTSSNGRSPDETDLPSVGSGWNLAAKRSPSTDPYEAPIPGATGIYVLRSAREVSVKTPHGKILEIRREWRDQSLEANLLPGWRAYSNREGVLLVFYGSPSGSYSETRILILGEEVKSVRSLSHDGSQLSDETTSY